MTHMCKFAEKQIAKEVRAQGAYIKREMEAYNKRVLQRERETAVRLEAARAKKEKAQEQATLLTLFTQAYRAQVAAEILAQAVLPPLE